MITRMMCRIALGLITGAVAAPELSAIQRRAIPSQVTINSVTCDRGSCRQPLELMNGRSVTIGLTGRGLDALVSGVVTDIGGRRIEGVTVELAPPGRPSRTRTATTTRDVTVTAQWGTAAPTIPGGNVIAAAITGLTGLKLRFTTNARGSVTAPLDLSISPTESPLPATAEVPLMSDLIISRLDVTPTSGPPETEFVVNVTVRNQGPARLDSSPPGAVFVSCGLGLDSELHVSTSGLAIENGLAAAVDGLAAGETQEFTFVVSHLVVPGTRKVGCNISTPGVSNESDTDNNRRSASLVITDPGDVR